MGGETYVFLPLALKRLVLEIQPMLLAIGMEISPVMMLQVEEVDIILQMGAFIPNEGPISENNFEIEGPILETCSRNPPPPNQSIPEI